MHLIFPLGPKIGLLMGNDTHDCKNRVQSNKYYRLLNISNKCPCCFMVRASFIVTKSDIFLCVNFMHLLFSQK